MNHPLIDAEALAAVLATDTGQVLVCDCSFELADPAAGRRVYEAGHLPGAVYLDLERDLSAPKSGSNGRHPLPAREAFALLMSARGAGDGTRIVAYDGSGGMYAARLWAMLRWAGHANAAVLDGGIAAWRENGGAIEQGAARARAPAHFTLREPLLATVDYASLLAGLGHGQVIVDARAADRFRGDNETLDPVAGHIPGALNRCFRDNLAPDGRFKAAAALRSEWLALLAGRAPADVVQQCGSGVTACHNLLAMEVGGLSGSVLYPGSWSEWCAQSAAPVARGD